MSTIGLAQSDEEIASCLAVMRELRPHLTETEFVARVRRQQNGGYTLARLVFDGEVVAVAGFRLMDNLASGKILYVDDLVTTARLRSGGHGAALFSWLAARARGEGCVCLELDSGVQRFDAHRFYQTRRMLISSHHFRLVL